MAQRVATDQDFNRDSRYIVGKVEIFFDGADMPPITVTRDDYLISMDILDESGAESSNPLGAISANEIDISLLNKGGRFSPTNPTSPYYSKITTGVMVKPYFRPVDSIDDVDWIEMGVYYVTNWNAKVTGMVANVTARDKLQAVFRLPTPRVPLQKDVAFKQFFKKVFEALGVPVIIDDTLDTIVPYGFIEGGPSNFLQEMAIGALAICNCDRHGNIVVYPITGHKEVRATITDHDQIIDIDITQSTLKIHDGVQLLYHLPQITNNTELLNVKNLDIPLGEFIHDKMLFSKVPVKNITSVETFTKEHSVIVSKYSASSSDIVLTTFNDTSETKSDVTIYGEAIDLIQASLSDSTQHMFKLSNIYIQNVDYAIKVKTVLNKYVTSNMPTLNLTIRGNPLFSIGDKIEVLSDKFGIKFTGVIQRMQYTYDGGLSCNMTLINSTIVEVIQ